MKDYAAMVHNQFGRYRKEIRSDNGGEYINKDTEDFLRGKGILHQLTVPYCPSQNGIAERKNRSLLEMTLSMLSEAGLPHRFCEKAINTAIHLQNRLPTKAIGNTPYELWFKHKPSFIIYESLVAKATYM